MSDGNTKQLFSMNKSANRKKIIQPTPLFQDTFTCGIGENLCPLKRSLREHEIESEKKDLQIHDKQKQIETLHKKFDDEFIKKNDPKALEKALIDVKESIIVAERDKLIQDKQTEILKMQEEIAELQSTNSQLEQEKENYMTTAYEADVKYKDRYKQYVEIVKKHDYMLAKASKLMAQDRMLDLSISQKSEYEKQLSHKINSMAEQANLLFSKVTKLKSEVGKFDKVSPESKEKKGIFSKLFRLKSNKDGSKSK